MPEQTHCGASLDCLHIICKHCKRPMRRCRETLDQHPKTIVGIFSRQECNGCSKRGGPPPGIDKKIYQCAHCKDPMTKSKQAQEKYPNYKRHAGHELCTSCYPKHRYLKSERLQMDEREAVDLEEVKKRDHAMYSFYVARRKRIARKTRAHRRPHALLR